MNQTHDEMLELETELEAYGQMQAEWRAEASHLERMRKRVLALIEMEHIGEPVNAREMQARADKRYLTHLEGQKEAESKANKYYAKWDTLKAKIEIRRSINASTRAQMNLQ